MRNLIIAACCAALMGSVSVAFAQTAAPAAAPDTTKADTPTKMKKKSSKKSAMKSGDTMTARPHRMPSNLDPVILLESRLTSEVTHLRASSISKQAHLEK